MMTTEESKASGKRLFAVIAILFLVVGAVVIVTTLRGTQAQTGSSSTTSTNLSTSETDTISAAALTLPINSTPGLDPEQIYASASHSVVTIQGDQVTTSNSIFGQQVAVQSILGSGFVVDYQNSMYVVTNYHVVDGIANMTVTFWNGDAYPAKVVGTDAYSDLAVVSLTAPPSEFTPLQVVQSTSAVTVGQPVFAIGNPYGLSGSFTYGIVSQLGRTIQEATTGNFLVSGVIQFSAPINPGNSGGPLLNAEGQAIGITTAVVSGSQGLGFAIPSSTILRELPSLISSGSYTKHAYLGIGGADMNYQLAQAEKTNVTYGVLIENLVSGGPAASAGLHVGTLTEYIGGQQYLIGGDIIVSINGTRLVNQDALSTYLEQSTIAGQSVQLGIIRSGSPTTITVVLGTRPAPPSE